MTSVPIVEKTYSNNINSTLLSVFDTKPCLYYIYYII
uniref:Uncharacterized protein n=1 Tax=Phage sp. ctGns7 TaxID=2828003 RepID=A0A8S5S9E1_9VIRU|nr:MAG TPA: hypothetical protein [Phage sp. ctGns7]